MGYSKVQFLAISSLLGVDVVINKGLICHKVMLWTIILSDQPRFQGLSSYHRL